MKSQISGSWHRICLFCPARQCRGYFGNLSTGVLKLSKVLRLNLYKFEIIPKYADCMELGWLEYCHAQCSQKYSFWKFNFIGCSMKIKTIFYSIQIHNWNSVRMPSIGHLPTFIDTTVAKYGSNCPGYMDVFWRTDPANEDGIQPAYFKGITTVDLNPKYIVHYGRPKLR